MILEKSKYRKDSSSLELERMIEGPKPKKDIVFHNWDREDYSSLVEERKKNKIKN